MKRHIKKAHGKIKQVKTWQIVLLIIIFALIATVSLRQNNVQMGVLRDKVVAADKKGDDAVEPLSDLRDHVFTHMNTEMRQPVSLVGRFNADVEIAREKAEKISSNPAIYKKAQAVCEDPQVLLAVRAQCIQDYVIDNAAPGDDPVEIEIPPKENYIFIFSSPSWTPDVAGLSIVVVAGLALWLAGQTIRRSISQKT